MSTFLKQDFFVDATNCQLQQIKCDIYMMNNSLCDDDNLNL